MIEVLFDNNDAILKFPKELITRDYVQKFLERLKIEEIINKNNMNEQQAWELSEEIKKQWWKKNKEKLLNFEYD